MIRFAALLLLLSGCSTVPLTEDEIYERDDREVQRIEQYYRDVRDCAASGQHLVIQRRGAGFHRTDDPPGRHDTYSCGMGSIIL